MRILLALLVPAMAVLAVEVRAEETAEEKYDLRYKFTQGETIRWATVHQGACTTKMKGHEQKSLSTSKSTKAWEITSVKDGQITFAYRVDDVEMWQQVGDRAEERYNSKTDAKPPAAYELVAATVGQTITEAVIDERGNIIEREDKFPKYNPSIGDLVVPLPDHPVAVGEEWFASDEVRVPLKGTVKRVKIRKAFKLEKVATGVATISIVTQVLTPVNDPQLEAQLMQHVTKGVMKFDIDAGRILSRRLDWNETVLGFEGPDSSMIYLARFTEDLIPAEPRTASATEKAGSQ